MKIILTDSSGFVGKNLLNYLQDFNIRKLSLRFQTNQQIDLRGADGICQSPRSQKSISTKK